VLVPVSEENKLGAEFKKEVEKEHKLHPDADVQKYIKDLGVKIVRAAKKKGEIPEGIKFTFNVIDNKETINAFAIPGGHIYFYSGLLDKADNEAEVVAVLGHEVAHVTRRHIAKSLVASYGLNAVLAMALGEEPGLLSSLAGQIAGTGAMLKHSRDNESDADYAGIPYTIGAGYDPHGLLSFFEKIKGEGDHSLLTFVSSHPLPAERIANAKSLINSYNKKMPSKLNPEGLAAIKPKL